jgi:hypothetical protein
MLCLLNHIQSMTRPSLNVKYDRVLHRLSLISLGLLMIGLQFSSASADPLSLSELNRFNKWVQCTEKCRADHLYEVPEQPTYLEQRDRFQCLQSCGPPSHHWEKDGARSDLSPSDSVYPIDRHDLQLAILEF